MEASLRSTSKIVHLNGVPARVWEGKTASGVEVHAFITRVAVREGQGDAVYADFERELQEVDPPSPYIAEIPARLII